MKDEVNFTYIQNVIMPKEYDEKELVSTGRELIENGLGSAFVFTWLKKRVEDAEERSRIMALINQTPSSNAMAMTRDRTSPTANLRPNSIDDAQRKAARDERNVRYRYEDFQSSIKQLQTSGIVAILIGLLYFISTFVFGAFNIWPAISAVVFGITLIVLKNQLKWNTLTKIYAGIGIYFLGLFLMYSKFTLPDRLIPGLGEGAGYKLVGIVTLINDFSPILYFLLLAVLSFPFFKMIFQLNRLKKAPKRIRDRLKINVE